MRRSRSPSLVAHGGAASLLLHVLGLLAVSWTLGGEPSRGAWRAGPETGSTGDEVAGDPTWVDLLPAESVAPAVAPLDPRVPGDQDRAVAHATAPHWGNSEDPSRPAPDVGAGSGRRLPEALRRDTSTLRVRLADGARTYQQSRQRTARRPASPQPLRQEPVVGVGDSPRTRLAGVSIAAATSLSGEPPDEMVAGDRVAEPQPLSAGRDPDRGQGPLDAEQGPRRFDVSFPGRATDDRFARAASDEAHPGRVDLSAAAAGGPADGASGRGPGDAPGAVSRSSPGLAPSLHGGPANHQGDLSQSTGEREYARQFAEIRRRVAGALRFPKRLALMLEQGETVVHFVVAPDGRLAGPVRVTKSAGFDEFDAAAVNAVTHAAPFPPTGRRLSVSMPIAHDNPVVR